MLASRPATASIAAMSAEPQHASTPTAAAEPAFYESTRGYRNAKSAVLLVVVPLMAAFPIWAMVGGVPRGHYGGGPYVFATLVSFAFIAGFAKLVYNIVADVREPVRIDATGVLLPSGRLLPWGEIAALRFDRAPFSRNGYLACSTTADPKLFRSIRGQSTLQPAESTAILQRIAAFLAAAHPNVKVFAPATTPPST